MSLAMERMQFFELPKPRLPKVVRGSNDDNDPLPPPPPPTPRGAAVAYSKMRTDRFGAVLDDILHAHAYCFANNLTYGGSCAVDAEAKGRSGESQRLVNFLGLSQELKLACPYPGSLTSTGNNTGDDSNFLVLDPTKYKRDEVFTAEWIRYVNARRSVTEATARIPDNDDDAPLQVAVYARRGDVTPCVVYKGVDKSYIRYLPNSYFLNVLDHYLPPDQPANVTVYSESRSRAEGFDEFRRRNYTVSLDAPIPQVWTALMTADVTVISKSSFSYVPAIFNVLGTVLYSDFWHQPLPGWVRINQTIQEQGDADLRALRATYCPHK